MECSLKQIVKFRHSLKKCLTSFSVICISAVAFNACGLPPLDWSFKYYTMFVHKTEYAWFQLEFHSLVSILIAISVTNLHVLPPFN